MSVETFRYAAFFLMGAFSPAATYDRMLTQAIGDMEMTMAMLETAIETAKTKE